MNDATQRKVATSNYSTLWNRLENLGDELELIMEDEDGCYTIQDGADVLEEMGMIEQRMEIMEEEEGA